MASVPSPWSGPELRAKADARTEYLTHKRDFWRRLQPYDAHPVVSALHRVTTVGFVENKTFNINGQSHVAPLAYPVAEYKGTVWACSTGEIIREGNEQLHAATVLVNKAMAAQMMFLAPIRWPLGVRTGLYTLMSPGHLALIRFDFVRYAESPSYDDKVDFRNIVRPDVDDLAGMLLSFNVSDMIQQPRITPKAKSTKAATAKDKSHQPTLGTGIPTGFAIQPTTLSAKEHTEPRAMVPKLKHEDSPPRQQSMEARKETSGAHTTDKGSSVRHTSIPDLDTIYDSWWDESSSDVLPYDQNNFVTDVEEVQTPHASGRNNTITMDAASGQIGNAGNASPPPCAASPEAATADQADGHTSNSSSDTDQVQGLPDPVTAHRLGIGFATGLVLRSRLGNELSRYLPRLRGLTFLKISKEFVRSGYLPLRLIAGNYRDGDNVLCHLCIYFERTKNMKNAPKFELIVCEPEDEEDVTGTVGWDDKHGVPAPYDTMQTDIHDNFAQFLPVFRGLNDKELTALAKYAFILASESDKLKDFHHAMPMNDYFEHQLRNACEKRRKLIWEANSDAEEMMVDLELRKAGGPKRMTKISMYAAQEARFNGLASLEDVPHGLLDAVETNVPRRPMVKRQTDSPPAATRGRQSLCHVRATVVGRDSTLPRTCLNTVTPLSQLDDTMSRSAANAVHTPTFPAVSVRADDDSGSDAVAPGRLRAKARVPLAHLKTAGNLDPRSQANQGTRGETAMRAATGNNHAAMREQAATGNRTTKRDQENIRKHTTGMWKHAYGALPSTRPASEGSASTTHNMAPKVTHEPTDFEWVDVMDTDNEVGPRTITATEQYANAIDKAIAIARKTNRTPSQGITLQNSSGQSFTFSNMKPGFSKSGYGLVSRNVRAKFRNNKAATSSGYPARRPSQDEKEKRGASRKEKPGSARKRERVLHGRIEKSMGTIGTSLDKIAKYVKIVERERAALLELSSNLSAGLGTSSAEEEEDSGDQGDVET